MAYSIKSDEKNCVNPDLRGSRSCIQCYYSHVHNGSWTGSNRCFNAGCLALDINRLPDCQKKELGL